jgi:hypothetical protein
MTYYRLDKEPNLDAPPDVEVFYAKTGALNEEEGRDEEDQPNAAGWYWRLCLRYCLGDRVLESLGEAVGPFPTEEAALEDARDSTR